MKRSIIFLLGLLCVGAAAVDAVTGATLETETYDLTGVWASDTEMNFYVRQLGFEVWWYGDDYPARPGRTIVGRGTLEGDTLTIFWTDVPKGASYGSGTLVIRVVGFDEMVLVEQTGDEFPTTEWYRAGVPVEDE